MSVGGSTHANLNHGRKSRKGRKKYLKKTKKYVKQRLLRKRTKKTRMQRSTRKRSTRKRSTRIHKGKGLVCVPMGSKVRVCVPKSHMKRKMVGQRGGYYYVDRNTNTIIDDKNRRLRFKTSNDLTKTIITSFKDPQDIANKINNIPSNKLDSFDNVKTYLSTPASTDGDGTEDNDTNSNDGDTGDDEVVVHDINVGEHEEYIKFRDDINKEVRNNAIDNNIVKMSVVIPELNTSSNDFTNVNDNIKNEFTKLLQYRKIPLGILFNQFIIDEKLLENQRAGNELINIKRICRYVRLIYHVHQRLRINYNQTHIGKTEDNITNDIVTNAINSLNGTVKVDSSLEIHENIVLNFINHIDTNYSKDILTLLLSNNKYNGKTLDANEDTFNDNAVSLVVQGL